ncbi:MAG TPA: type II secretion system F family protein [Beijerinckiaceae bacterium]|nr:type II secretion system F family protein [Beijerinckiaceae bacterium]
MELQQILSMVLAATAAGGLAYAVVIPYVTGDVKAEQRQKKLLVAPDRSDKLGKVAPRNRQVAESLKEIERKKADQDTVTLQDRIIHAGLDWTRQKFYMVSVICGGAAGVLAFLASGFDPLFMIGGIAIGALGLPRWILIFKRNRRVKQFIQEFPNAMDVIVRGVKSGLPLGDCLRIIANEAAEPVRSEFRQIVETQALGLSLAEASQGLFKRVPTPEANFFGIVIDIQSKAGGNLSEVLGNLSRVLRERRKMRDKVSAMSMEAKASAAIIGALPIIVAVLVGITTPDYMALLFTTEAGKFSIVISAFWMACGILSMKKMINFDI